MFDGRSRRDCFPLLCTRKHYACIVDNFPVSLSLSLREKPRLSAAHVTALLAVHTLLAVGVLCLVWAPAKPHFVVRFERLRFWPLYLPRTSSRNRLVACHCAAWLSAATCAFSRVENLAPQPRHEHLHSVCLTRLSSWSEKRCEMDNGLGRILKKCHSTSTGYWHYLYYCCKFPRVLHVLFFFILFF